jgi:hypothetical protein
MKIVTVFSELWDLEGLLLFFFMDSSIVYFTINIIFKIKKLEKNTCNPSTWEGGRTMS